jgi:hypothetical protein
MPEKPIVKVFNHSTEKDIEVILSVAVGDASCSRTDYEVHAVTVRKSDTINKPSERQVMVGQPGDVVKGKPEVVPVPPKSGDDQGSFGGGFGLSSVAGGSFDQ